MATEIPLNDRRWIVHTERDAGTGQGIHFDRSLSSQGCSDVERNVISRVTRRYQQLHADLTSNTSAIPSLTFIYDRNSGRWSVALVGSGGVYGSASTRQVALAPVGMSLRQVMAAARESLNAEPFLVEDTLGQAPAHNSGPTYAQVASGPSRPSTMPQTDVVSRRPSTRLSDEICSVVANVLAMSKSHPFACADIAGLSPLQSLTLIADILPEELARSLRWSTAYLCVDTHRSHRVITCSWPSELVVRHPEVHGSILGHVNWSSSGLIEGNEALRWLVAKYLDRHDFTVRNQIERAFSAYFASLTCDVGWSEMSGQLISMISHAMPLSDADATLVVTGRRSDGTRGTQHEIDVLINRWKDQDTVRFVSRNPNSVGLLISDPSTPAAVKSSTLRLCRPPEFGGDGTIWWDLVSSQLRILKSGERPATVIRTLSHRDRLVRDVLADLGISAPHGSRGTFAENWIEDIGLDPGDYDDLLPPTSKQVFRKVTRNTSDLSPFAQFCQTMEYKEADVFRLAHDLVRAVPGSLVPVVHRLPDLGVSRVTFIRELFLDANEEGFILDFMRRLEASLNHPESVTLRADVVEAIFTSGLFRLKIGEDTSSAEAILAFERLISLPTSNPTKNSTGTLGRDSDTASRPGRVLQSGEDRHCGHSDRIPSTLPLQWTHSNHRSALAISLGMNILLISIVFYLLY